MWFLFVRVWFFIASLAYKLLWKICKIYAKVKILCLGSLAAILEFLRCSVVTDIIILEKKGRAGYNLTLFDFSDCEDLWFRVFIVYSFHTYQVQLCGFVSFFTVKAFFFLIWNLFSKWNVTTCPTCHIVACEGHIVTWPWQITINPI